MAKIEFDKGVQTSLSLVTFVNLGFRAFILVNGKEWEEGDSKEVWGERQREKNIKRFYEKKGVFLINANT